MENCEEIKLKDYYVYELVDNKGEVFYVGKGKGDRAHHHEYEAKKDDKNSQKLEHIRNNKPIKIRVIGRFDTEKEAFAVESTLIHWVYGFDNLTNATGGHGCDTIREHNQKDEKLLGIDIPKRERVSDGSYSKKFTDIRDKNDIVPLMDELKNMLENRLDIKFNDISLKEARFTKLYHTCGDVDISITITNASKKISLELNSISGSKEDKEKLKNICASLAIDAKDNGSYAPLKKFDNQATLDEAFIEEISSSFNEIKCKLENLIYDSQIA